MIWHLLGSDDYSQYVYITLWSNLDVPEGVNQDI
jgi:hypothetical protein